MGDFRWSSDMYDIGGVRGIGIDCVRPWALNEHVGGSFGLSGQTTLDDAGGLSFTPQVVAGVSYTPLSGSGEFSASLAERLTLTHGVQLRYNLDTNTPIYLHYTGLFKYHCTKETSVVAGLEIAPFGSDGGLFTTHPRLHGKISAFLGMRFDF